MVQRNREYLVGAQRGIVSVFSVHHVVKVAAFFKPETLLKRIVGPAGMFRNRVGSLLTLVIPQPIPQIAQRVVPQRINLNCFAAPRSDYPIVYLRIHPGQLISRCSLSQESVMGVYPDAKARSADVVVDDLLQQRQYLRQQQLISGCRDVSGNRVKKPQSCVGGVIQPFVVAFWKHIRDQTVANVMSKGS